MASVKVPSTASSDSPASAWRARSTLLLFGVLALGRYVPAVVDPYSLVGVPLLLYLPSYLVSLFVYDGPWGLETVVYGFESLLPVSGAFLWNGGLVVTYYLFAVAATWGGRHLETAAHSLKRRGDREGEETP